MVFASKVPYSPPVMPASIPNGIADYMAGRLRARLPETHRGIDLFALLIEAYDMYKFGHDHPGVNPETTHKALSRHDCTSLDPNHTESAQRVRELVWSAQGLYPNPDTGQKRQILGPDGRPLRATGICLHGMVKGETQINPHLKTAAKIISKTPGIRFAFVNNYDSHGNLSGELAARHVEQCAAAIREAGATNPLDVDTVLDSSAWVEAYMPGTDPAESAALKEQAREKLLAVLEICKANDILLKVIQEACVHAWTPRFFECLYDSSALTLDIDGQGNGAECVKNGTGHGAKGGDVYLLGKRKYVEYSDFVSVDRAFPELVLPMLLAIRDFNETYKNAPGFVRRFPKFSGELKSEVDAAVFDFLACEILGADTPYVIGGGKPFRDRCLRYLHETLGPECGFGREAFDDSPDLSRHPELNPYADDYADLGQDPSSNPAQYVKRPAGFDGPQAL